ncbi:JAB domain-containing protein [Qipengyuania gelatinilytica]|uniref:JAB domain-containing protein n=1 Tax=Qipengyuania gelatinilytica TaxID=2867231 RepID=A0ABX9A2J6_9SPHN|nr:JAB domain-containing protein [Qipengyuania gelatinilytica]QZD94534.1 JAB domain-containing protein [Qipengyuania gelatinilytica]
MRFGFEKPNDANEVGEKRARAKLVKLPDGLIASMRRLRTERMVAIFADSHGRLLSRELVAEGGVGQLRLSLRRIFSQALKRDAHRMILAHNHPSGSSKPSDADVANTLRLQAFAKSLGISLDDHLIIGRDDISSMRGLGLIS